jgi:hypothetical protein
MHTRPDRDPQQMAQCVCSIACECDRSYSGETGRPLAVRLYSLTVSVALPVNVTGATVAKQADL